MTDIAAPDALHDRESCYPTVFPTHVALGPDNRPARWLLVLVAIPLLGYLIFEILNELAVRIYFAARKRRLTRQGSVGLTDGEEKAPAQW